MKVRLGVQIFVMNTALLSVAVIQTVTKCMDFELPVS